MNDMQVFNYENKEIRTVVMNNEPWWVAKDVCEVLEHTNSRMAIASLDDDEKGVSKVYTLGGEQEMTVITEAGLYSLIIRSNKPEAKQFKRWITHEVLPSIRNNGMYARDELLDNPDLLIEVVTKLRDERNKRIELEEKAKLDAPKVEFFEAVAGSKDAIDIGSMAKVLDMGMGRNKMFEIMRRKGILMSNNQLYQKYIDLGYFRLIEQRFVTNCGDTHVRFKTLVYQKGIDFVRKQLSKEVTNER